jgi:hypothetical protein
MNTFILFLLLLFLGLKEVTAAAAATSNNYCLKINVKKKIYYRNCIAFKKVCPLVNVTCPYIGTVRQNWDCQLSVNRFYNESSIDITVDYGNNQTKVFYETSLKLFFFSYNH